MGSDRCERDPREEEALRRSVGDLFVEMGSPPDRIREYIEEQERPADMDPALWKWLRDWTNHIARLYGLDEPISSTDACAWMSFFYTYALFANPLPDGRLRGSGLLARWNTDARILRKELPGKLPIFLWKRSRDLTTEKSFTNIGDMLDHVASVPGDDFERINDEITAEPTNIWYHVPQWWIFKTADVEFFEKLRPDICGEKAASRVTSQLTAIDIMKRWGISRRKLKELVCDGKLTAYHLSPVDGIQRASEEFVESFHVLGYTWGGLANCLFKRAEIEAYEKKHSSLLKAPRRNSNRDKDEAAVISYVKGKYGDDPAAKISQADLIRDIQKTKRIPWHRTKRDEDGKCYKDRTIEGWLRKAFKWRPGPREEAPSS